MKEYYDFEEDQRLRRLELQHKLEHQAAGMGTGELLRSLAWEHALTDHYAEIGEGRGGESSTRKANVIRAELRRRGAI